MAWSAQFRDARSRPRSRACFPRAPARARRARFRLLRIRIRVADPVTSTLAAPDAAVPVEGARWYKDAIIYQLHIKAFYDSNGDGIGDFRGLSDKLDYIRDLGVNTIWLLPFYP